MKKLTLNTDALEVASFEVAERAQENGTAKAWGWSDDSICPTTTPSENRSCY
ncbi:MAG TPA: hypothetical protein VHG93_28545 [Longimicrobium sp.]|nr:hypothetical protein [Longimicrobium sp.]